MQTQFFAFCVLFPSKVSVGEVLPMDDINILGFEGWRKRTTGLCLVSQMTRTISIRALSALPPTVQRILKVFTPFSSRNKTYRYIVRRTKSSMELTWTTAASELDMNSLSN